MADLNVSQKTVRLLVLIALVATSQVAAQSPALPLPQHPTCFDLARTANRFIALGEEQSTKDLKRLCELSKNDLVLESDMREQIGWICRLLFVPTPGRVIRAPMFGGLSLPWNSMTREDWPFYPLAESEGVFFVLSQGYMLAGFPEDPQDYLEHCRATGVFRTKVLPVPTEGGAQQSLSRLLTSKGWLKIRWKDSQWNSTGGGFSYNLGQAETIAYLTVQTKKG